MYVPPLGDGGQLPPKFRRIFGGAKLRPQPRETLDILLRKSAYNSNYNKLHVPRGMLCPLLPGDPTSYPTENTFGGDPNEAPSQNQRFCDGVPVVHFGVSGQKFIIFDWGKFREPHSALGHERRRCCTSAVPQIMPLAMRPLREEMAHCRRTARLARRD